MYVNLAAGLGPGPGMQTVSTTVPTPTAGLGAFGWRRRRRRHTLHGLGLFEETDAVKCADNDANRNACMGTCLAIGAGMVLPWCTQICVNESCEYHGQISSADLVNVLSERGYATTSPGQPQPSSYKPPTALAALYPWGVVSLDTKLLQQTLNQKLVAEGLCALTTDGKLGAGTCGAAQHYGIAPSTCRSFTAPKKCAGTSPAMLAPTTAAAPTDHKKLWMIAGGVAAAGLVAYLVMRKKK